MNVTRTELLRAARGVVTPEQAEAIWETLERGQTGRPRLDGLHVLYYAGALIGIGGMGWFVTKAWDSLGGGGVLTVAAAYAACFLALATLLRRRGFDLPAGLLVTLAVCTVPLGVYGFERLVGLWPQADPGPYRDFHHWVRGGWALMEVATIAAALVALWRVPFAFLTSPLAGALWYLSMDLTPIAYGPGFTWQQRLWVSVWFGLATLVVALVVDRRRDDGPDYAFWLYLCGLAAFSGGLSLMNTDSEWRRLGYALVNLALIVAGVLLRRAAFLVFGSLGLAGYLGHLAYRIFADSVLFPVALTAIGVALIVLGVLYQRHRERLEAAIRRALPAALLPPPG